jgi:UDP-3-O-[3-hydroxymyristoyl] glucosamine N-acyltransferase
MLAEALGLKTQGLRFCGLGVSCAEDGTDLLSFLGDAKFAAQINDNPRIRGVFVERTHADLVSDDKEKVIVEDPKWFFFKLLDHLAKTKQKNPNSISRNARIHDSVTIAQKGVVIEDDVYIEPGVVVLEDVTKRKGAVVRAGAVLGVDGFEHKKTSRGIVSVTHDGCVVVCKEAEVGPLNAIIKGFSYRSTIIGEQTKLDAHIHYAHGVQSGQRCLIAASTILAGHVSIGDDVWIGPGSVVSNRISIGDGAFITLGSVVSRDVPPGQRVTGNFAIPHAVFMADLKKKAQSA